MFSSIKSSLIEKLLLGVVFLAAVVNALLYTFVVPPWQHYDEPTHFEHVWLIVHRGGIPKIGDYDQNMRREVAESMIAHGFFRDMGWLPDLTVKDKPIWIGAYSQLGGPPLYYLYASLAMRLVKEGDVEQQLYACRLASALLFLLTILACYGVMVELTPPQHPLRIILPLTLALLPAFADLMTALNDDAGAIVAFSWFLWAGVRLIRRKYTRWAFHILDIGWLILSLVLCTQTKRNAYSALPLAGLPLLFLFFRDKWRKAAWGLLAVAVVVGLGASFAWSDAYLWFRRSFQPETTRLAVAEAPHGAYALRLALNPAEKQAQLAQFLPRKVSTTLAGKTLTLGGWVWADQPVEILSPALRLITKNITFQKRLQISQTPVFFALTATVEENTGRVSVNLNPWGNKAPAPGVIYYDGLVLAEGDYPTDQPPVFLDADGLQGTWGGKPFTNLLRNGSAEIAGPRIRPWLDRLGVKVFPEYGLDRLSFVLYSLEDLPATGGYYQFNLGNLFRTFWAKFGWAQVSLMGSKPYRALLILSGLAGIGLLLAFWRNRRQTPWEITLFFGATLFVVWGLALFRFSNYLLISGSPITVARYAYLAAIPTLLLFDLGWFELLSSLQTRLRLPSWISMAVFGLFFAGLDAYALLSIHQFYAK